MGLEKAHSSFEALEPGDTRPAAATPVNEHASPTPSHAEVLEAVGRLAADIGHDLNNQLSVILNYSFVLERELLRLPTARTHLLELTAAAWRASLIVDTVQRMGGPRLRAPESIDINACVVGLLPVLRQLAPNCDFHLSLSGRTPPLSAPRSLLEQVICAAALNAAKRAYEGSTLTLETGSGPGGKPQITIRTDRESGIPGLLRGHSEPPRQSLHRVPGLSGHAALRRAFRLIGARSERSFGNLHISFDRRPRA